jgi:DNA-binding response OmpR family regulator
MESLGYRGLVVVVSGADAVREALMRALEARRWVVLALDDGAELFDFFDLLLESPRHRVPRLIIDDAAVPGPDVLDTCAEARRQGLDVPFLVLADEVSEAMKTRASQLGRVSFAPRSTDAETLNASL